jgi:hypothetical protein
MTTCVEKSTRCVPHHIGKGLHISSLFVATIEIDLGGGGIKTRRHLEELLEKFLFVLLNPLNFNLGRVFKELLKMLLEHLH